MPDPVTGVLGATIGGSAANIFGSLFGRKDQEKAAERARAAIGAQQNKGFATQKEYFNYGMDAMRPFLEGGAQSYRDLLARMPELTSPVTMTTEELENTPGYQFVRDQGIRAANLGSVAKGLSGAQLKGISDFTTGLALDKSFLPMWNIANTNKTNAFERLFKTAQLGTDSAKAALTAGTSAGNAALGSTTTVGGQLAGIETGLGNAQAASDTAIAKNAGDILGSYPSWQVVNKTFGAGGRYGSSTMFGSGDPTRYGTIY